MMRPLIGIIGLTVVILSLLWSFRMGEKSMELAYIKKIEEINRKAEAELKTQQVKIDEITASHIKQRESERARIVRLENELRSRKAVKSCIQDTSGNITAFINDDVLRVLREAASDQRIPKATSTKGFIDPETAVTADHLGAYSFYAIEQYNSCAADYNTLVEMVK